MALDSLLMGLGSSGSSSSTGLTSDAQMLSTGIDAAGTAFGLPPGTGSTAMSSLNSVLKIFGIKDLSCIGSQSFKKSTLEIFLNDRKTRMQAVTNTQQYADFLTDLTIEIGQSNLEIPRYASACSRDYRKQYLEKVTQLFQTFYIPNKFSEQKTSKKDFKGGDLQYTIFKPLTFEPVTLTDNGFQFTSTQNGVVTPNTNDYLNSIGLGGIISPASSTPSLTSVDIPSSILAQLTNRSLTSGIPLETLKSTYINGGFTVDSNGNIIWSASAGNAQNNTSSYLLLGGGLVLVYMAFFKKK